MKPFKLLIDSWNFWTEGESMLGWSGITNAESARGTLESGESPEGDEGLERFSP